MQVPFQQELSRNWVRNSDQNLIQFIEKGVKDWKKLDEEIITPSDYTTASASNPYNRRIKGVKKVSIPILRNFRFDMVRKEDDPSTNSVIQETTCERIPESMKGEYFQRFSNILRPIPKAIDIEQHLRQSLLHVAQYTQNTKLQMDDLNKFPELEIVYSQERNCAESSVGKTPFAEIEKIYTVNVYDPHDRTLRQSLQVLGRQTLQVLEKMIDCVHNHLPYHETCDRTHIITNPPVKMEDSLKQSNNQTLPSFFYLKGKFYVMGNSDDQLLSKMYKSIYLFHKNGENSTYEEDLQNEGQTQKRRKVDPTEENSKFIFSSEELQLSSIEIEFGMDYLYVHYGHCEHIIQIIESHHHHPRFDLPYVEDYPVEVHRYLPRRRRCQICDVISACYLVYNDRFADSNPCLFCRSCFVMLHCDEEGALLFDDFYLFPYLHDR